MLSAPIPHDETSRLATLRLLKILDTQPEERFDRLTRMAKRLFDVPIAMVTLVDAERQWFKSCVGIKLPETPRDISFCGHAILSDEVMMVPDALQDERFFDNPLVTGEPKIRFYAGCPLKVAGHNLGTLCVIDDKPRAFDEEEQHLLRDLARMAEQELSAIQLATTDDLTGVSNRRGFEVLGNHVLKVCARMGKAATLLLFDLNKFKAINDTFGHSAGDRALQLFAQGLLEVFRESDVIGRLGGDEFAVLLTGTSKDRVEAALGRLEDWLSRRDAGEKPGYDILFSAGQIEFNPVAPETLESLLVKADAAMYTSKRAWQA